jgi:hypothetical protein
MFFRFFGHLHGTSIGGVESLHLHLAQYTAVEGAQLSWDETGYVFEWNSKSLR